MRRIIRSISVILLAVILSIGMITQVFAVEAITQTTSQMPVEVKAKAAILMDCTTGKVLMAMNEHKQLYPASVTKIITLLLAAEAIDAGRIKLEDKVTCSADAAAKGGSQIWLKEGEVMTVDELLKAIAVGSANDASCALGEYIAGSEEGFVRMINDRAAELGMKNTHFDNCTGLDDTTDTHLTTAYDIALMSVELMKHEFITKYTTIWMDSLRDGKTELVNTNRLVRFYPGTTGLKTGTTSKAGHCLSATAKREGTHLVAVVLGSENSTDRFEGAKAMLNWGFANYTLANITIDASLITDVSVLNGVEKKITPKTPEVSSVLIPKGKEGEIKQDVELAIDVEAPVEEGQVLGKITLSLDGDTIGEYPLVSPIAIKRMSFFDAFVFLLKAMAGSKA